MDDRWNAGTSSASWSAAAPTYALVGNGVRFYPAPSAGVQLRVSYTSEVAASPTADWSAWFAAGWERWVVADVCRKVSLAEGKYQPASAFQNERDDAERIVMTNIDRDAGLRRVRDVEGHLD